MDRAGDLLSAFFRMHNISGGESYVSFFSSWHDIVGTDIASHSQPVDIRGEALVVEVDHPGWMQLLSLKKDHFLSRIRERFAELGIANIHMKLVDAGAFSGPEAIQSEAAKHREHTTSQEMGSKEAAPPPSRNEKEALSNVSGERLKDTLERLRQDLQSEQLDDTESATD